MSLCHSAVCFAWVAPEWCVPSARAICLSFWLWTSNFPPGANGKRPQVTSGVWMHIYVCSVQSHKFQESEIMGPLGKAGCVCVCLLSLCCFAWRPAQTNISSILVLVVFRAKYCAIPHFCTILYWCLTLTAVNMLQKHLTIEANVL